MNRYFSDRVELFPFELAILDPRSFFPFKQELPQIFVFAGVANITKVTEVTGAVEANNVFC